MRNHWYKFKILKSDSQLFSIVGLSTRIWTEKKSLFRILAKKAKKWLQYYGLFFSKSPIFKKGPKNAKMDLFKTPGGYPGFGDTPLFSGSKKIKKNKTKKTCGSYYKKNQWKTEKNGQKVANWTMKSRRFFQKWFFGICKKSTRPYSWRLWT